MTKLQETGFLNLAGARKGQITLFIILAIVIVAVFGIVYYIYGQSATIQDEEVGALLELPTNIQPIYSYMQGCIMSESVKVSDLIGLQGGLYDPNYPFYEIDYVSVPYYFDRGFDISPSLETLEEDFCKALLLSVPDCLDGLNDLTELNYGLSGEIESCDASFMPDGVTVSIKYPLVINLGSTETTISDFSARFDSSLPKLFNISKQFIAQQKQTPNEFPTTDLMQLAYNNNITYVLTPDNRSDTIIVTFNDSDSPFMFALGYNWSFLDDIGTSLIGPIDDSAKAAYVGYSYSYTLDQLESGLTFSVDSDLDSLTIDSSGTLTFTPSTDDEGPHAVEVTAENPLGLTDSDIFTLYVNADNNPPEIQFISTQYAEAGTSKQISITVDDLDEGETIIISFEPNPLFDDVLITQPGVPAALEFTPDSSQIGEHMIDINAVDTFGNTSTFQFKVVVE